MKADFVSCVCLGWHVTPLVFRPNAYLQTWSVSGGPTTFAALQGRYWTRDHFSGEASKGRAEHDRCGVTLTAMQSVADALDGVTRPFQTG